MHNPEGRPNSLQLCERLREVRLQKKKSEVTSEVWLMWFKEGSHSQSIKVHGEAANGNIEAAASYPGDLARR